MDEFTESMENWSYGEYFDDVIDSPPFTLPDWSLVRAEIDILYCALDTIYIPALMQITNTLIPFQPHHIFSLADESSDETARRAHFITVGYFHAAIDAIESNRRAFKENEEAVKIVDRELPRIRELLQAVQQIVRPDLAHSVQKISTAPPPGLENQVIVPLKSAILTTPPPGLESYQPNVVYVDLIQLSTTIRTLGGWDQARSIVDTHVNEETEYGEEEEVVVGVYQNEPEINESQAAENNVEQKEDVKEESFCDSFVLIPSCAQNFVSQDSVFRDEDSKLSTSEPELLKIIDHELSLDSISLADSCSTACLPSEEEFIESKPESVEGPEPTTMTAVETTSSTPEGSKPELTFTTASDTTAATFEVPGPTTERSPVSLGVKPTTPVLFPIPGGNWRGSPDLVGPAFSLDSTVVDPMAFFGIGSEIKKKEEAEMKVREEREEKELEQQMKQVCSSINWDLDEDIMPFFKILNFDGQKKATTR